MEWSSETIAMVALLIGVLLFLWRLHGDVRGLDRDMRGLSNRIACKVEGLLEGLRDSIAGRSERAAS